MTPTVSDHRPVFKLYRLLAVFLTVIAVSFTSTTYGAPHIYQTSLQSSTPIGEQLEFYEQEGGPDSLASLLAKKPQWQISRSEIFNRGFSRSTWWVRFTVHNDHAFHDWLLEVSYPVLDHLTVYVVREQDDPMVFKMGDKLRFSERPINHRHFLVPLNLEPQESVTVYLRVTSTSAIQLPMTIWDRRAFSPKDSSRSLIEGVYFGGLLAIGLYNLLLFLVLSDRTYFYYVANVLSLLLFVACLRGWTFQFFWPNATQWNDTAIVFFLSLTLLTSWVFSGAFLQVTSISKVFSRIHYSGIAVSTIFIFIVLWVPYPVAIGTLVPFALYSCVWGVVIGVGSWRSGNSAARYYLIAWSMFLVGSVVLALNRYHIIPRNMITDSALQIGSLLDVILFSLALADRINTERSLRFEAQRKTLLAQQHANEKLEMRVEERTNELTIANEQLQQLSDTDQLTGLKNRRFLEKVLDAEFLRSYRYQRNLSILLIDVDHFKSINDSFGHIIGDHCLQTIAKTLLLNMRRPSDLISRYGGEEFCAVLPEIDTDSAMSVAENIRESISSQSILIGEHAIDVTVSIGVYSGVPQDDDKIVTFIARADRALYKAKYQGRNQVILGNAIQNDPPPKLGSSS